MNYSYKYIQKFFIVLTFKMAHIKFKSQTAVIYSVYDLREIDVLRRKIN